MIQHQQCPSSHLRRTTPSHCTRSFTSAVRRLGNKLLGLQLEPLLCLSLLLLYFLLALVAYVAWWVWGEHTTTGLIRTNLPEKVSLKRTKGKDEMLLTDLGTPGSLSS